MSTLVPIDNSRAGLTAPSRMQQRMAQGKAIGDNFSSGTSGGFFVLSIRASKFHVRQGQDETTITDPSTGYAVNYLDVVLVDANKSLAKTYYAHAYSQGNADQPDCWSLDSVRPDPSVVNKINPTCGDCPKNAFGSRVTPDGKAAKACSDHRRVAVVFPGELAKPDPTTILLRVPQSSLRSLANYSSLLNRNGYEPGGCITRLSFESGPSYPKLEFRFVGPLSDQEFSTVESLIGSQTVRAMLQGADFANAASAANQPSSVQGGLTPMTRQAPLTIEQTGFGPGMLTQPQPSLSQPIQQSPMPVQVVEQPQPAAQAAPDLILKLPDGKLFNTATGQYVEEPVIDPDVLALPDGKFFHKTRQVYVENQYVGGVAPAKRRRTKAAEPQAAAEPPPAAATEPAAQAPAPAPAPAPAAQQTAGNGHVPAEKPNVIAASPKLEQLLSGLASKKDPK